MAVDFGVCEIDRPALEREMAWGLALLVKLVAARCAKEIDRG